MRSSSFFTWVVPIFSDSCQTQRWSCFCVSSFRAVQLLQALRLCPLLQTPAHWKKQVSSKSGFLRGLALMVGLCLLASAVSLGAVVARADEAEP
ncbi:MAG TPA: hypothetical protein PKH07_15055, partial [bacterium]|nr:hypothetical protein [bacterium]